ncbi:hypothetical protein TraAM80_07119 [Trypanosoma rangeli]|uniref:Uncharacterized protein n=1 Tax=Trypanosoma rangeli TaxID=5698 RepID=A0A422N762_TRYRA|nr:uncharacterized protein TraAM80_07119 [Trypanosoma rangeli]RNF01266.1 hypothetical protein TraAM80_07119 [Trypanosoma rangeli]|eukprot:RNF01266.1 hypothetical protein TraAM80_07119 [Trypanosoma rangeli]
MHLRRRVSSIFSRVNDAITVVSGRRSYYSGRTVLPWRRNVILSVLLHQRSLTCTSWIRWASTETASVVAAAEAAEEAVSSSSGILLDGAADFIDLGLGDSETGDLALVVSWEQQPALGVVRAPEIPEGQEYSRLNIPLTHPRAGRTEPRPNSRSIVAADNTLCLSNKLNKNEDNGQDAIVLADTDNKFTEDGDGDEEALPYDDELFAEMLLKMEVEGAIDEAWQDARKAHIEDVVELVEVLRSLKVREICAIDVSAKTGNFDYMIVGTCEGPRHIHLAAWAVQEADSLRRVSKIKRKQTDHTWEVVPVGRIIVNLMQDTVREEMALERKWAVTKCMDPLSVANAPVSEGRQVKAHGLWTLTLNLQDLEDFEVDYCKDVLMRQL